MNSPCQTFHFAAPDSRSMALMRRHGWLSHVLSGLLCLSVSKAEAARADAAPSQEFWKYFAEFGDAQGELFDPADYAAVATLPAKAQREFGQAQRDGERSPQDAQPGAATSGVAPEHASSPARTMLEQSQ